MSRISSPPNARAPQRIDPVEWRRVDHIIRQQYIDNDLSYDALIKYMQREHSFKASKQQYARRFQALGIKKYSTDEVWTAIPGALKRRRVELDSADVYLHNRFVPNKRVKQELSRRIRPILRLSYGTSSDTLAQCAPSPPALLVRQKDTDRILVSPPTSLPWFDFLDGLAMFEHLRLRVQGIVKISDFGISPIDIVEDLFGACKNTFSIPEFNPHSNLDAAIHRRQTTSITQLTQVSTIIKFAQKADHEFETSVVERTPGDWERATQRMSATSSAQEKCMLLTMYVIYACANNLQVDLAAYLELLEECSLSEVLTVILDLNLPTGQIMSNSLLVHAIQTGHTRLIQLLLAKGLDPDMELYFSRLGECSVPLHAAIRLRELEAAKLLLTYGADIDRKSCSRYVLEVAFEGVQIWLGSRELRASALRFAEELIDRGAKFDDWSILHEAVRSHADVPVLQKLIDHGACVNTLSFMTAYCSHKRHCNLLNTAIQADAFDLVHWLLNQKLSTDFLNGISFGQLCNRCPTDQSTLPLISGIWNGPKYVRTLLSHGADPNGCECHSGFVEIPPDVSSKYPWTRDEHGRKVGLRPFVPLQAAIISGNIDVVVDLIDAGAHFTACHGNPALLYAVDSKAYQIAEYLLRLGMDPNCVGEGVPGLPLATAIMKDDAQMLALLLSYGADPSMKTGLSDEEGFLVWAYMSSKYEYLVKFWRPVRSDSRINLNRWLHDLTLSSCHIPSDLVGSVMAIVDHPHLVKAYLTFVDTSLYPPLLKELLARILEMDRHITAFDTLEVVLSIGAKVDLGVFCRALEHRNWLSLMKLIDKHESCELSYLRQCVRSLGQCFEQESGILDGFDAHCVDELLRLICCIPEKSVQQSLEVTRSLLHRIHRSEQSLNLITHFINGEGIKHLAGEALDLSWYEFEGHGTLIHLLYAITSEVYDFPHRHDLLISLIDRGVDVGMAVEEIEYSSIPTLQFVSSVSGATISHAEIVTLVEAGAVVNQSNERYPSILQSVAAAGDLTTLKYLVSRNASVNEPPPEAWHGKTALQEACNRGRLDVVEYLIAQGADVNAAAVWYRGATALQCAVGGGYFRIMQILVEAGADVNAPGAEEDGRTAIQLAAMYGRLDFVHYLLIKFKQKELLADVCEDAAEYAFDEGHSVVGQYLLDYNRW